MCAHKEKENQNLMGTRSYYSCEWSPGVLTEMVGKARNLRGKMLLIRSWEFLLVNFSDVHSAQSQCSKGSPSRHLAKALHLPRPQLTGM